MVGGRFIMKELNIGEDEEKERRYRLINGNYNKALTHSHWRAQSSNTEMSGAKPSKRRGMLAFCDNINKKTKGTNI
jgi:hypothetical protein